MLSNDIIVAKVLEDHYARRTMDAAGIIINEEPNSPPDRPGLIWVPKQLVANGPITWVESEYDPTLPGTSENPIIFKYGCTVYPNYYYTLNDVRKVWMGEEVVVNPSWDDDNFVEF